MQQDQDQFAWILLALLFSGLLISLIKGGWTGPGGATDWFKAKFLGQPRVSVTGPQLAPGVTVPASPVGKTNVPGGTPEAPASAGESALTGSSSVASVIGGIL